MSCTDSIGPQVSDEFPCRDWTDRALALAVVARREDAYAELYRRHCASIRAAIHMMLGNQPACEDVTTDVFVEFWFTPTAFDPDRGSLLTYLRLRARSHSVDVLRSETRRRRREEDDLHADRHPAALVDSALLSSETAAAVRKAVALLPLGERQVIQLAFFEGLSYRAVAVRLGLPEGTVKSRIRNGLRRLRLNSEVRAGSDICGSIASPLETRSRVGATDRLLTT